MKIVCTARGISLTECGMTERKVNTLQKMHRGEIGRGRAASRDKAEKLAKIKGNNQ